MRWFATLALLLSPLFARNPGATLTGRVIDSTGAGIRGAFAELRTDSPDLFRTRADFDGTFHFDALAPGNYLLKLQEPGFVSLTVRSILISDDEKRLLPLLKMNVSACGDTSPDYLTALPPGTSTGSIAGTVHVWNSRKPRSVSAAEVTLVCGNRTCGTAKTSAVGAFRFTGLAPGDYGFRVTRGGFFQQDEPQTYWVREGLETVYSISLEACEPGRCDPKYRPKRPMAYCE